MIKSEKMVQKIKINMRKKLQFFFYTDVQSFHYESTNIKLWKRKEAERVWNRYR